MPRSPGSYLSIFHPVEGHAHTLPVIDASLRDCAVTFLKRGRRATNISNIINARSWKQMTVDVACYSATDTYTGDLSHSLHDVP